MNKRIKAVVLVMVCLFFFVENANANRSVSDAVSWAEGQVGSNDDSGCHYNQSEKWENQCMHFCGHVYEIIPSGISTAITGWNSTNNTFGNQNTNTNFNNIPAGALVFFDPSIGVAEGHVGLATGNGEMIHAWTSGVIKSNISEFSEHYLGWRWPQGWIEVDISDDSHSTEIILRQVGNIGWYPINKSCVNASNWYKIQDGRAVQEFTDNGICWSIDPIAYGVWYEVVFGENDLPEACIQQ